MFTWRVRRGRQAAGTVAGTVNPDGYVQIQIDGVIYKAHQLAWFMHYDVWPTLEPDHKNRVRDDNRITNLRELDRMDNAANNDARLVRYVPDNGSKPWIMSVQRRGVRTVRSFATEDDALEEAAKYR